MHRTPVLAIALVVLFAAGCSSLSTSATSVSDFVSSPFTMASDSSGSSSPDDATAAQVSSLTVAHVEAGGSPAGLRREIGALAATHGITDWELHARTWQAIGAGLAAADLDDATRSVFVTALAATDEQARWLSSGML